MIEHQMSLEAINQRLDIIGTAEPDTIRKLHAYELEEERLQHLLSQNPPPVKREQLERMLESVQLELWEIRASAAFLGNRKAILQQMKAAQGGAAEHPRDNP